MTGVSAIEGELVEILDLPQYLPGDVQRIGRTQNRATISVSEKMFRGDPDITKFDEWENTQNAVVVWSPVYSCGRERGVDRTAGSGA